MRYHGLCLVVYRTKFFFFFFSSVVECNVAVDHRFIICERVLGLNTKEGVGEKRVGKKERRDIRGS